MPYAPSRRARILAAMPWSRLGGFLVPPVILGFLAVRWHSLILAVLAAVLLASPVALAVRYWLLIGRALLPAQPVDRRWTITEEDVRVSGGGATHTWRWPSVTVVEERTEAYVLCHGGGVTLDIARDTMTPEQDGELRRFLTGRGLLRG